MSNAATLGLIAGSGSYPLLLAEAARAAGVRRIVAVAFTDETDPSLAGRVDAIEWIRVGQLQKMLVFLKESGATEAIMAGQIAPKNLFALRPDWKALLLLAKLPRRNAESIFGAIADELATSGTRLLPATTFMEKALAPRGLICGKALGRRELGDVRFGFDLAKEVSRLDIGQTVVVKNGTILAVEGFDGSDATIRRGAGLAGKAAVVVKVSKVNQDTRFDVPVIGLQTIRVAAEVKVRVIAVEAGQTLLLDRDALKQAAQDAGISVIGV